jgi:hypothetical protein
MNDKMVKVKITVKNKKKELTFEYQSLFRGIADGFGDEILKMFEQIK